MWCGRCGEGGVVRGGCGEGGEGCVVWGGVVRDVW